MGGEETESASRRAGAARAANFEPTTIFRSSSACGCAEGPGRGRRRRPARPSQRGLATQLIVETAGARWVSRTDVNDGLPERPTITTGPSGRELIGIPTTPAEQPPGSSGSASSIAARRS
jgi:hypothetical protein